MKTYPLLLIFLFALSTSCKKSTQSQSVQVLLQNKWTLLSEVYSYPTISYASSNVYIGVSTDFYQFKSNDTLIVSQTGSPVSPFYPFVVTHKYSLQNDKSIILYGNSNGPGDTLTIQKISADSLVLTSPIYITYLDTARQMVSAVGVATNRLYR